MRESQNFYGANKTSDNDETVGKNGKLIIHLILLQLFLRNKNRTYRHTTCHRHKSYRLENYFLSPTKYLDITCCSREICSISQIKNWIFSKRQRVNGVMFPVKLCFCFNLDFTINKKRIIEMRKVFCFVVCKSFSCSDD